MGSFEYYCVGSSAGNTRDGVFRVTLSVCIYFGTRLLILDLSSCTSVFVPEHFDSAYSAKKSRSTSVDVVKG